MRIFLSAFILSILFISCESEKLPKPPDPRISEETSNLEAIYYIEDAISISASIWNNIDYVRVPLVNKVTNTESDPGVLHANNTFGGVSDFNNGDSVAMTVKALYDDEYFYVLVQWNDNTVHPSDKAWKYPAEDTNMWTAHYAPDRLFLQYTGTSEIEDVWQWNAALSAPLGYAIDQNRDKNGTVNHDAGKNMYVRNAVDSTNTGGPKYEWSGNMQNVSYANGDTLSIDPKYYLKDTISFEGDIALGAEKFEQDCAECHGKNGDGELTDDYPLVYATRLNIGAYAAWSRDALLTFITSKGHEGKIHINLTEGDKINLMAFMRGIAGVPGYMLQKPEGSVADVRIESNFNTYAVNVKENGYYKVMFKRKRETTNPDDIAFSPLDSVYLTINVSDGDNDNYIGSDKILVKLFEEK